MSRRWRTVGAFVVSGCVLASPGTAHADPAGPTSFRTEVMSIVPATPAVAVTIEGGDSFVRIAVEAGTEVAVQGYDGEPYLMVDAGGTVFENRRSPATYYNATRLGTEDIPAIADADAAPDWEAVASGGTWAWHDHRAHWMSPQTPIGMAPGDSLPPQVIPLTVDGSPVEITVVSTLVADPSCWPTALGALTGAAVTIAALVAARRSTSDPPVAAAIAALWWGAVGVVIGVVQFLSLPGETGPSPLWWIPPVVAVASAIAAIVAITRRASTVLQLGLILVAGAQLVVWVVSRRLTFVRGVLPTDAPFWVDRAATAAVGAGALLVVGATIAGLVRLLRQPASATSIASSRSS